MFTSVMMIALSGFVSPEKASADPGWVKEYALARNQGQREEKPLAVFIGSGKAGWNQVSKDGRLDAGIYKVLTDNYVRLYVNTDEEDGKRLASALDIGDGPGLIITTSSGRLQAFRHEGDLDNEDLASYLSRFADPDLTPAGTETVRPRVSYYPSQMNAIPHIPMGFGGGRSC